MAHVENTESTDVSGEWEPEAGARMKIYLHPGQLFASAERCAVTTILGSCVALCLWDPISKVGGINHYLLPFWVGECLASARFGNVAVRDLIDRVLAHGGQKWRLQAKLFGGACVLEAFRNREKHLGMKNVEVAQSLLEEEGIPVVAHDVGGQKGRKLIYHTDSGTAWVKQL
jgi:chemotaxis protein CheD